MTFFIQKECLTPQYFIHEDDRLRQIYHTAVSILDTLRIKSTSEYLFLVLQLVTNIPIVVVSGPDWSIQVLACVPYARQAEAPKIGAWK